MEIEAGTVLLQATEDPGKIYAGNVTYLASNGWLITIFNDAVGLLTKPTRGVFTRPQQSRYGPVPPGVFELALAKANGAPIEIHGAEAARRLGLSTQTQVRPVYYTSGRSKTFQFGKLTVTLHHVSPRKLIAPGTTVGLVVSALWYLGKEEVTTEVLSKIKAKLSAEDFAALKAAAPKMPIWMSDALHNFEKESTKKRM